MTVSRMLKIQLLGHNSVKEEVKRFIRELGVVEVTDVSTGDSELPFDEERIRDWERLREMAESAAEFLGPYAPRLSLFERASRGPLRTTRDGIERLSRTFDVETVSDRCNELERAIKGNQDELYRSFELVRSLEPWSAVDVPLEMVGTGDYIVQFWILSEKTAADELGGILERYSFSDMEVISRSHGRIYLALVVRRDEASEIDEALKTLDGFVHTFPDLEGTPNEIMGRERRRWSELESRIEHAETEARRLADARDSLLLLLDYYIERVGLGGVERSFHRTDSTFLLEGWVRAVDLRRLEEGLGARFEEIELHARPPEEGEIPPIKLENRPLASPFEFVTTLYGRPVYEEIDPTPLLAPFFILFFALCLTDAGYGLALAAISAVIMMKFKPSGGAGKLMRLLFMGGIVTAVIGIVTGGIFGLDPMRLPGPIQQFIVINPLEEPMKMLNIAFLLGLFHMLFGMGIRMVAHARAGLVTDALFDDLLWILFLVALAPLGFSAILGGDVPAAVLFYSSRASMVIAAGIFLSAGRRQKGIARKLFKGMIGFYGVVGYFGDVLSYARLLALGLATSAIALAVNGIAGMVKGLPYYTGYVAAVLVLVLGHGFNLAVNTLGAFVHSGRLQYLEFFGKFFTGGGREFKPFRSERRHSVVEEIEEQGT
jgi:V/A-type H+-transporting ATPase subunit I